MEILLFLPVLLFSVVVHEVAHAQVAKWEGDDTAERLGRITLNPLPHLDLWGSFLVPLILYFMPGNFLFGWAKPVPVNPGKYRDPKWGDVRVSLAGIAANFGLAALCTLLLVPLLLLRGPSASPGGAVETMIQVAEFGVFINLILAIFNLVPIPPLDGSHVLGRLLPRRWAESYRKVGRYGILVVLGAFFLAPETSFRILLWPVRRLMGVADAFLSLWI